MSVHVSSWTSAVEVSCSYVIVEFKLNSLSCHLAVRLINKSLADKAATIGPYPTLELASAKQSFPKQSAWKNLDRYIVVQVRGQGVNSVLQFNSEGSHFA